jgi:hypothetical protein
MSGPKFFWPNQPDPNNSKPEPKYDMKNMPGFHDTKTDRGWKHSIDFSKGYRWIPSQDGREGYFAHGHYPYAPISKHHKKHSTYIPPPPGRPGDLTAEYIKGLPMKPFPGMDKEVGEEVIYGSDDSIQLPHYPGKKNKLK